MREMSKLKRIADRCPPLSRWYEVEDLPGLGWLRITWVGEENVYFTLPDGSLGFVKADGWSLEVTS